MGFLKENGIKGVAFDIDGTFYPLKKTNIRVLKASIFHIPFALSYNKARQIARTEDSFLLLPLLSKHDYGKRMAKSIYGKDDEATVNYFLKKEQRVFTDSYEKSFRSIKSYSGVKELLSLIKESGYQMAVLSDFPIGTKLKSMEIESFFPLQLSSEDSGRFKPCLTPFKMLSDRMELECEEILYIGDSIHKDIDGARSLGFKTCLITDKESYDKASLTVSSWEELKERLF